MEYESVRHEFPPVWDGSSEILILGSFPSVKSREEGFFYGHPRNRFWDVMAAVTGRPKPVTIKEKKTLLLSSHIAVWDVIGSCQIQGSSDSSIRDVTANDILGILSRAPVRKILANGKTAAKLYERYIFPDVRIPIIPLPSTSPANAAWTLEKLIRRYRDEITCLQDMKRE